MLVLWGISLICLLSWLLMPRDALLQSPAWWKPVAFISLALGSLVTLVFEIAFAAIFLIDGDIYEMLAFMDVTGSFSPGFFMLGTGIGLAYSELHLRPRLEAEHRLIALAFAVLMTISGIGIALADWPRFSYYFGILLRRMFGQACAHQEVLLGLLHATIGDRFDHDAIPNTTSDGKVN